MKSKFIPKGKNIMTRKGCTCKNVYKDNSREIIKNSCTLDSDTIPWCLVNGECGVSSETNNNKLKWWDHCDLFRANSSESEKIKYSDSYLKKNIFGIIFFVIIFIILVPEILFKSKKYRLLEIYVPNLDLVASALVYGGGPGNYNIFQELYNLKSKKILGKISRDIINIISITGLCYLIIRNSFRYKSFVSGYSVAAIMFLMTYLLPNEIISTVQVHLSDYIYKKTGKHPKHDDPPYLKYISIILVGLVIAGLFIFIEHFLIQNHVKLIDPILNKISFLKKMDNKFM